MRPMQVFAVAFAVCLAASAVSAEDPPRFLAGTYYTCDMSTETRADETAALDEAQPELARRFTEICPSHTDYVWDMGVE